MANSVVQEDWEDLDSEGSLSSEDANPDAPVSESAVVGMSSPLLPGVDIGFELPLAREEHTHSNGVHVYSLTDRVLCCSNGVRVLFHWSMPQTKENPTPFESVYCRVLDTFEFQQMDNLKRCMEAGQDELKRVHSVLWDRFYVLRCGWLKVDRKAMDKLVKDARARPGVQALLAKHAV
jgi:hypothetical protein